MSPQSTGLSVIEEAADVRQGLRLIQPSEHRRDLSGSVVWMALGRLWRNSEIASGGMVEGGLPPPSSHLGDRNKAASVVPGDLSQNPFQHSNSG